MGKSTKLPVLKDKKSKTYWRQIRSRQKQAIRQFKPTTETLKATYSEEQEDWIPEITEGYIFNYEDLEIPKEKEIVNDYDYCDYKIDYHNCRYTESWDLKYPLDNNVTRKQKYSRK